jgi:surfactin synthase thioesterase subunit
LTKQSTGWGLRFRREGASRLRLLCFPDAGGAATVYGTWPEGLPVNLLMPCLRADFTLGETCAYLEGHP